MDLLLYTLAMLLSAAGIVGAILPGVPGAMLSFAALLIAFFCSMPPVTVAGLFIYLIVGIAVTAIDAILPIYFTKRFGGSRSGILGSTVGMVVGFFTFPPIGFIICPFFGAVLGELLHDRNDVERAFKVGSGVFISFIFGTGIKFFYSLWILGLLLTDIFPAMWRGVRGIIESL